VAIATTAILRQRLQKQRNRSKPLSDIVEGVNASLKPRLNGGRSKFCVTHLDYRATLAESGILLRKIPQ
jgi:hypothetical protein